MPRVAKYPKQVSALLTEEDYNRLAEIERNNPLSMGEVIRKVIRAGLPKVEREFQTREDPQMVNTK